ncbi:hypothetical protein OHA21_10345 [Actinoplanes sp. NBC_00393]|uniref:hypothetical protein n=1 Tax=Actinoplanes sp. NBC_00393 TaxID=2975953 RepID=UPI002E20BF42
MRSQIKADVDLVGAVHAAFARVGGPEPDIGLRYVEPIRWINALLDGGLEEWAVTELRGLLRMSEPPGGFDEAATRIRSGERRRALALAMLDSECVIGYPHRGVAATVVRLADGDRDLEDAALRKVLEPVPAGMWVDPYRVGVVVSALAEAHRDEPSYLDHLAGLLAGDDRRHLAFATALLGPLGLDEILRRCGTVPDEACGPLVAAFAEAGRFDEAFALAVTLGADARQQALLRLAAPDLPAARAKALVAAYRKCPKVSRQRDDQVLYRCRWISLLLALDRVDDALTDLAQVPDCRYAGYGPAPLAVQILRRFVDRPAEVTPARLRAVLDVLTGDHVIGQELRAVGVEAVRLVHRLGDAAIRAELAGTDVPRMRDRMQISRTLADAGLAWARVDDGDHTAADPLFAEAAAGRTDLATLKALLTMAPHTRIASRDPDLFSRMLAVAYRYAVWLPYEVFGADEMRLVPDALIEAPLSFPRWVGSRLSTFAADTGDWQLLAFTVAIAPDAKAMGWVGADVAVALARAGDAAGAAKIGFRPPDRPGPAFPS